MSQAISPFRLCGGTCLAVIAGLGLRTDPARAAEPADVAAPPAHWVTRTFDYTYMGFTARFSCDGLRDNVRDILLALGARRKDLEITSRGCTNLNGPEPFPGVIAHFSVLVPDTTEDTGKVANAAEPAAQWHTVDLVKVTSWGRNDAPCELLEQIQAKALPLFTTRNLNFRSSCFPHQVTLGEIQFKVDVLRMTPAAAAPAT
jgi:hypothetical protein